MVQRVSTGSPFEATFGYSRAVRHEDTVYVSGTTGYDYATMTMPDDVGQQAANALATIDRALKEAGSSIEDTVRAFTERGGRVVIERAPVDDTSWWAVVEDPDGNAIGLFEGPRTGASPAADERTSGDA